MSSHLNDGDVVGPGGTMLMDLDQHADEDLMLIDPALVGGRTALDDVRTTDSFTRYIRQQ